jgi:hypothetical protein
MVLVGHWNEGFLLGETGAELMAYLCLPLLDISLLLLAISFFENLMFVCKS